MLLLYSLQFACIFLQKIFFIIKFYSSQLKKFLGRKMESAMNKAKSLAHEVSHRHREEKDIFEDDAPAHDTMHYVKVS